MTTYRLQCFDQRYGGKLLHEQTFTATEGPQFVASKLARQHPKTQRWFMTRKSK